MMIDMKIALLFGFSVLVFGHVSRLSASDRISMPVVFEELESTGKCSPQFRTTFGRETAFISGRSTAVVGRSGNKVTMTLKAAASCILSEAMDPTGGTSNYFVGRDVSRWRTGVKHFGRVRFKELYPGIDVVYHGRRGPLEYDLLIAPGADVTRIQWDVTGASKITTTASGDLEIRGSDVLILHHRPEAYQMIKDRRVPVQVKYIVAEPANVRLKLGKWNRAYPLLIDPILEYATYLGGVSDEYGYGIAVDSQGSTYVSGQGKASVPPELSPFQQVSGQQSDAFVAKLSPDGGQIVYFAYIGGDANDSAVHLAVDATGRAYVVGITSSLNLPVKNAAQSFFAGGVFDGFVARLSPNGRSLEYLTYLGGSGTDIARSIALDPTGAAYVAGGTESLDFPLSENAFRRSTDGSDAFVTKIAPTGQQFIYSTYVGGGNREGAYGISVDSLGQALLAGWTYSTDYPTRNTIQEPPKLAGGIRSASFVTQLAAGGSSLNFSTYLGGESDSAAFKAVADANGDIWVAGFASSQGMSTLKPLQSGFGGGGGDAYILKFASNNGGLIFASLLGWQRNRWCERYSCRR